MELQRKRKSTSGLKTSLVLLLIFVLVSPLQAKTIYLSPTESQKATVAAPKKLEATTDHCEPIIQDCRTALKAADALINEQSKLIDNQEKQIQIKSETLQAVQRGYELEKERADAWYRDPFMVIPAAILIGFIAGQALERR